MLAVSLVSLAAFHPGRLGAHSRFNTFGDVATAGRTRPVYCMASFADAAEPKLETVTGYDFIPLLTALKTADFLEADRLTREGLIKIAGEAAVARGFVYFSEVASIPHEDLASFERLWLTYSGGKFGYSVQHSIFETKKVSRNLDLLYDRIGWKNGQGRLLRWLPDKGNEFVYDLDKAKEGHLPLTNTLRGSKLLERMLDHPLWQTEEFKK